MNRRFILLVLAVLPLVHRRATGPARGISSGARVDRPGAPELESA